MYISLVCESYFLVNFHIGICKEDVDKLVNLLREIDVSLTPTKSDSKVSDEFIIPYPPGVPIAVPGEVMTTGLKQRIEEYRHSGSRVVRVKKEVK
uniref:Orn/Lys/Arg family decarboxylase n=1 Tax=Streptococcus mutans TaxID=1309 RepID=UPI00081C248F